MSAPEMGQPRLSATLENRSWVTPLALAALLSVPYVFFSAFSHMSFFDDEGTLMVGFRSLLEGHRMYDEIYSLYGPMYNGLYRLIYVVLHVPLTHTTARTIAASLWVGYSATFALVCFRMTGSRIAALFCYALTLTWLTELMNSPGHPEEISLLMLASLLLAIGSMASPEAKTAARLAAGACAGGLVAALVLVKVNVGVFAGECLLLVLMRQTGRSGWLGSVTAILALLLLITPVAVAALLLDQGWVRIYVGFASLAIASMLIIFIELPLPINVTRADWISVALGGLVVAIIVIAGTLSSGSSAYAVLNAVVLQSAHFMRNWFIPLKIGVVGGVAAPVSLCLALVYRIAVRRTSGRPAQAEPSWLTYVVLLAKAAFVVAGIVSFRSPLTLFQTLVPFCWLLMIVPAGTAPHVIVLRSAVAVLGALLSFYPFPVAGHQIDIGGLMCVIALPVLSHDILSWTLARAGGRYRRIGARWGLAVAVVLLLLLDGSVTLRRAREYLASEPLGLPGTAMIRLPLEQAKTLRWVTTELRGCRSSYSLPGLLSFAFWTGHPLPTPLNINDVLGFIRSDQQGMIVTALRRSPDLCIVYSDDILRFLDRGQIALDPPLLHYVREEFTQTGVNGRYAILKRRVVSP